MAGVVVMVGGDSLCCGRFTFDFFSMRRIKINDYVSFPLTLNMDKYIMNDSAEPLDYELYSVLVHSGTL